MENFSLFDIAIIILILLLGLKGIFRGFIKESFSLIGLVGGIFVASRYGDVVGSAIEKNFYHFQNESAQSLVGFLIVLALFWGFFVFLGTIFSSIANPKGSMSVVEKVLGFVVGSIKVFFIFSIIFYILSNIEIIQANLQKYVQKSAVYPYFVKTGEYIVKIRKSEEKRVQEETSSINQENTGSLEDTSKEKQQEEASEEKENIEIESNSSAN